MYLLAGWLIANYVVTLILLLLTDEEGSTIIIIIIIKCLGSIAIAS